MSAITPKPEKEITSLRPYDYLRAYIVSDVHLNNHPFDRAEDAENPRRRNFRMFLTQINDTMQPNEKVQLILNGDILDINGSWFEDIMPWDTDSGLVLATLNKLLLEILENNLAIIDEIRRMLKHPLSEVIYIFGNHDGMLQTFPECQQVIRDFISTRPEEQARLHFAPFYVSEELDLYIEHGHALDPFNRKDNPGKQEPPLGDVVNILIVNRFVDAAVDRMRENGYSEAFVRRMHNHLHDIEYLRPLSLVPVWIQTTANHYQNHPENEGKRESVKTILLETVSEILQNPQMTQYMIRHLRIPKSVLYLSIKTILRLPAILPFISFITTRFIRKGHSNKFQYKAAQRIRTEKGYRLVAFGHTHIPGVLPLSENAYYFNTGSWKPVINLFKHSKDPVELEYLHPEVQFNKVERCGILLIEKSEFDGKTPAEFALKTIQSGMS